MINSGGIDMTTSIDSHDIDASVRGSMDFSNTERKVMIFTDSSYVIYLKYDDHDHTIPVIDIGDHELFICDQIATFKNEPHQSTTVAEIVTTDNTVNDTSMTEGAHSDDDTKDTGINECHDNSQELTTSMLRALNMI
jgi:hypothetical protein